MATGGVEFADVSFSLPGGRQLLHDISLGCAAGSTVALLGRSGSGKTTLLRTVNGLVRPTGGRVIVNGEDVATTDLLALRQKIGYVIQETGLFPHMTIERNLTLPLEVAGRRSTHNDPGAAEMLRRVGLGEDLLQRYPWQLSGGQRQRVGVARALITQPRVLLMDEPFGALDPLTRAEMQHMMRDLLAPGNITTLIVTHDLQEALVLADRVVFLQEGNIEADLPAGEVRQSSIQAVREYVHATEPGNSTRGSAA